MISKKIDIPFEFRGKCFFCGEFDSQQLPIADPQLGSICDALEFPFCDECAKIYKTSNCSSIEHSADTIQEVTITHYKKHLAIGTNWSFDELKDANFSGSALEGFGTSAWQAYEIAKSRIKFKGWEISVDGISLPDLNDTYQIHYDGLHFKNHKALFAYVADIYQFNEEFFNQVINIYGFKNIDAAITYCNLTPAKSPEAKTKALAELTETKSEQDALRQK